MEAKFDPSPATSGLHLKPLQDTAAPQANFQKMVIIFSGLQELYEI